MNVLTWCGSVLAIMALAGCEQAAGKNQPDSRVERGKYLVTIGGCNDCHTPLKMGAKGPEPDMSRMLSGHPEAVGAMKPGAIPEGGWGALMGQTGTAFAGPFGISYASNLTPHEGTGIGVWTEELFLRAMRTGKHMGGGRPIMPPMPWQNVAQASDEDLKAMYAYFRSIPAIKNAVPDSIPAPPPPGMPHH